jgi:hypothetical protein
MNDREVFVVNDVTTPIFSTRPKGQRCAGWRGVASDLCGFYVLWCLEANDWNRGRLIQRSLARVRRHVVPHDL